MRTPPPTVPGMPARHSMPARPCAHGAEDELLHVRAGADFDGVAVVLHAPPVIRVEAEDRAVDAVVADEQVRAQAEHVDRDVVLHAAPRRFLQLFDTARPQKPSRGPPILYHVCGASGSFSVTISRAG
jgi:hypothetical protein